MNVNSENNGFYFSKKAIDVNKFDIKKYQHLMSFSMTKGKNRCLITSQDTKLIKAVRLLLIKLGQTSGFFNEFEKTQYMSLLMKDEKSLKNI